MNTKTKIGFLAVTFLCLLAACGKDSPTEPINPVDRRDSLVSAAIDIPVSIDYDNSPLPVYPPQLEQRGITGSVRSQFVVDTMGKAEINSIKILSSDHPLFSEAVLDVIPRMRFFPASFKGKKVRQLVQLPFNFHLR